MAGNGVLPDRAEGVRGAGRSALGFSYRPGSRQIHRTARTHRLRCPPTVSSIRSAISRARRPGAWAIYVGFQGGRIQGVVRDHAGIHHEERWHLRRPTSMPMSDGFWLGVLGGLLAELFSISRLRYRARNELPLWITSPWYWIITALLIVSGGVLVGVYLGSGVAMTPLLAVNIGASAPLILQSLVSQAPAIEPGRIN